MATATPPIRISIVLVALALAGCADTERAEEVRDPYEAQNRAVFDANTALFNVVSSGDGGGPEIPSLVSRGLDNVAHNLDTPRIVVNDLLQGDAEAVVRNGFRFAINTVLGIGGLFDPAASMGLPPSDNDFGKTLYVWGVGPGAYTMLPVLGPMTERDLLGKVVDTAMNPLNFTLPETERYWTLGIKVADKAVGQLQYGDTIGDVLDNSADPYATARSVYLQNRRYELTGGRVEDDYVDPYEDLYGN